MSVKAKTAISPYIWIALLITLGLVYWQWSAAPKKEVELVAARRPKQTLETATDQINTIQAVNSLDANRIQARGVNNQASDDQEELTKVPHDSYFMRQLPAGKPKNALFVAHEWLPAPVKPAPPASPQVPPLPYNYVGSLKDVLGGDLVILMQQKKILMPTLGSSVDAQWQLDAEDAQAVYFTYIPLNKRVVLSKNQTVANPMTRQIEPENNPTEEMPNR